MIGVNTQRDASLLYIVGTDRPDQLTITGSRFEVAGSTDIYQLLGKGQPFHRLQLTPNYLRQSRRPELDGYSCLMNLITEAEDNPKILDVLRKLVRGLPGKVVNRPEAVLKSTRDQVSRRLQDIPGLLAPRAIRLRGGKAANIARTLERSGLSFPLIVRRTGTHTGKIVGLFDTIDDVAAALPESGDYIATEFVDFVSPDGYYRKYRLFFIGPHLILRHMLASEHWNVHAKDRRRVMAGQPGLVAEEKQLFERPEGAFPAWVHAALRSVRQRMELDFFGMDFGLTGDNRVLLFEANATMNFFPFLPDPEFAYVQQCIDPARDALCELLGLPATRPTAR